MALGNRLEDKVAIVTGACTRGEIAWIGQATSILMAKEGAKVLLCDIDKDRVAATQSAIEKEGGIGKIFIGDVTSEKDCETMINEYIKQFGKLDILFNNVGGSGTGMVTEIDEADWQRSIDLNLKSAVMGSKYAIPAIFPRSWDNYNDVCSSNEVKNKGLEEMISVGKKEFNFITIRVVWMIYEST